MTDTLSQQQEHHNKTTGEEENIRKLNKDIECLEEEIDTLRKSNEKLRSEIKTLHSLTNELLQYINDDKDSESVQLISAAQTIQTPITKSHDGANSLKFSLFQSVSDDDNQERCDNTTNFTK
ncbi:MAG TPA: hypothetical protein VJN02_09385 [Gammaproteobacteria bacterium]|nr:hypothetical protein [Gammaproteobacteria bacterium]